MWLKGVGKQSSSALLHMTFRFELLQRPPKRKKHKSVQAVETIVFQILYSSVDIAPQHENRTEPELDHTQDFKGRRCGPVQTPRLSCAHICHSSETGLFAWGGGSGGPPINRVWGSSQKVEILEGFLQHHLLRFASSWCLATLLWYAHGASFRKHIAT